MSLNNYSNISKLLHRIYLGNSFVAKTSFDIEQMAYYKKAKAVTIKQVVFVTGLARAGTTALFNALHATGSFASLTYADMPFLLMPSLGKKLSYKPETALFERAHKDGILINNKSPEAFDEYFWKIFLNNKYINPHNLTAHTVPCDVMAEFKKYMALVCYSYKKENYLSKNNNNILRIKSLQKSLPNAKVIVLFRHPLTHAHSLLKQHIQFTQAQKKDGFIVDYFNYLGHYEFGLNHKPFQFKGYDDFKITNLFNINYWLYNWLNYYKYLLDNFNENFLLIAFEDICNSPGNVENFLNQEINSNHLICLNKKYKPTSYEDVDYEDNLFAQCMNVYNRLYEKKLLKLCLSHE
jgi:Sulfotransferase domain.